MRKGVLIGTIVVAVLVLAIILYGLLDTYVLQANRAVATVNGEKITLAEFQSRVRYTRNNLVQSFVQNLPMYEAFASDPTLSAQFGAQLQDIMAQLDPSSAEVLGQQTLDRLIEEKLIAQEAKKRGITISDEELNTGMQEAFGFFANGTPVPTQTVTTAPTSTLSATQIALLPPTATAVPTLKATATSAATKAASTPTEAASTEAATVTETPSSNLPTSAVTMTPTTYTEQLFNDNYTNFMTTMKTINVSEADIKNIIRTGLLTRKLMDEMTADQKSSEEQVWARHILVETEEIAKEVKTKLDAGEDFAKLAAAYSKDNSNKARGGDLGWFPKNFMVSAFDAAAWGMKIGEISEPVKTDFGYHIIQVLGHEERPLSTSQVQQRKTLTFEDWLKAQRTDETVKINEFWKSNVPLTPVIPPDLIPLQLAM